MRFAMLFVAGLVVGASLRLVSPPDAAESPAPAPGNISRAGTPPGSENDSAQTDAAPVTTAVAAKPHSATDPTSLVSAILRDARLEPLKPGAPAEPSWLYVRPPESALLRSNDYVEASIVAAESVVDEQCAPLFLQLALPPETEDELRRVLAEMVFARREINALAAVDPRRPPPEQVRGMIATSDESFRQRLEAKLGPAGFARFEAFFDSLPARAELGDGFLRVAALAEPFTAAQREALVAARRGAPSLDALSVPAELTDSQRAAFAQWQLDRLALAKLDELRGRPPAPPGVQPIYTPRPPSPASLGR